MTSNVFILYFEFLLIGEFSSKSDIWSFGILVWEVMTLGYQPYPGLSNDQVIDYILDGYVLKISDKCPIEM